MAKDQLLTIEEAAQYLNVSKTSLRRWTKSEKLPCIRIGVRQERRFYKNELDKFLSVADRLPEPFDAAATATLNTDEETRAPGDAVAPSAIRHLALYFHDRDELWRLFRPYVVDHLSVGAPFLYIHDKNSRQDALQRIRSEGWDPDLLIENGLLKLLAPAETYLRSGAFVPARMIDFMEAAILNWRACGHDKILLSSEVTSYLSAPPDEEGMIEYEHLLNDMLRRYPQATMVCHYDLRRLSGAAALGGWCSHPHIQLPDRLTPGLFLNSGAHTAASQ